MERGNDSGVPWVYTKLKAFIKEFLDEFHNFVGRCGRGLMRVLNLDSLEIFAIRPIGSYIYAMSPICVKIRAMNGEC